MDSPGSNLLTDDVETDNQHPMEVLPIRHNVSLSRNVNTFNNYNHYSFNNSRYDTDNFSNLYIYSDKTPLPNRGVIQNNLHSVTQGTTRNENNLIYLTTPASTPPNHINIYYQNVRGLRTKLRELTSGLPAHTADIYALTETWLCEGINDQELGFRNLNVFRTDRSSETSNKGIGGGVLLAVKKSILAYKVATKCKSIESVYVAIRIKGCQLVVGNVYLPPKCSMETISNFIEELDEVRSHFSNSEILLCGDFNLRNLIWQTDLHLDSSTVHTEQSETLYSALYFYHNLKQHSSIRNCNNVQLDLVFSNIEKIIVNDSLDPLPIQIDTHHPPLDVSVILSLKKKNSNYNEYATNQTVCY